MAARNRDLARFASRALHLANGSITGNDGVLLPLKPAWAACRLDLLHVALVVPVGGRCQRRRGVAGEHVRLEGVSQHCTWVEPKRSAEGLIDEGQLTLLVAPQDDIGLIVQEIAISNLVLADLPLNVLERLKTPLQLLANVDEALELGR